MSDAVADPWLADEPTGPTAAATDDRRLHARLSARDPGALADLYELYGSSVRAVASRLTGDRDLADDITQAVFLAVWLRPEAFDPSRSFGPWLNAVARNRSVDALRLRYRTEAVLATMITETRAADDSSAEDRVDTRFWIGKHLAELPARERSPIDLAFFEGLSYREVAARLGVAEGTVKTRIHAGLTRLGRKLDPRLR